MARFKILLFLVSLALLGAVMGGAWWFYTRVLNRDEVIKKEIKQISGDKRAPPDPGLRRFDMALEGILGGSLDEGRGQLYDMLRHFPDSKRAAEAKRIIGEMNMDYLFSQNENKARVDHVVQPGESLNLIARKNQTTVEAVMRANGMMSSSLQPGDHLFLFPIDFQIVVDVTKKTLTLLHNGSFFKEYVAEEIRLPSGIKLQPASVKPDVMMEVNDKAAWYLGKRVQSTDTRFMNADKWIMAGKSGFNIRALPRAKIESGSTVIVEPHGSNPTAKTSQKVKPPSHSSSTKHKGTVIAEEEDVTDATSAVPENGVFLAREDVEELYTIIRTKTTVRVVK